MRFEHRAVFESLELVLNSIRIELQDIALNTRPRPSVAITSFADRAIAPPGQAELSN